MNNLRHEKYEAQKGRGRPKGSVNKVGKAAKDAIAEAAAGLGGAERLVNWAKEAPENERAFWTTIYPKLIPVQVSGEDGGPVQLATEIRLVGVRPGGGG